MVLALSVIGASILFWIIGFSCGSKDPFPCHHYDYEFKALDISRLEIENYLLRKENEKLKLFSPHWSCPLCWEHKCHAKCEPRIYLKTPDEQKIFNLIKETKLTVDQLADEFKIR